MFKKIFTGIIIALAILGGMYGYFLYAGNPSILWDWILGHQLYTAIFFVSIVLLYILQGTNKMFRFLTLIIILINLFIIGDVFFRNNIGLNSQQFITLFALILLALAITYITHWVRYIFMLIVGLGIAFVLLTGVLPMYENMPSINDFIQSKKVQIINEGANQGTLLIKNALGTKEINIKDLTANDIDLSQKTQISFASKTTTDMEKIFIDLGNGAFVNLNPQSAVTLEQSGGNTVMQILQGNVQYHIPTGISGMLQIIGKYKGKNIQSVQNTIRGSLTEQFEQEKERFFVEQLGGTMVLNPAIDKVIGFFINTLYSISPKTYQNNLANYNNIQQYLGIGSTGTAQEFTGESLKSMIDDIMGQMRKGAEETKINQRLQ